MRFFLFLAIVFQCCGLRAEGALGGSWGVVAGFGGSSFDKQAHPVQAQPGNLFSILAGDIPHSIEPGNAGGLGLDADLNWRRVLDLQNK